MRRGQFEILGLAIIVVIISMGVFFLLTFTLEPNAATPEERFFEDAYSQRILDAFLKTTHPDCPRLEIKDLLYARVVADGRYPPNCASEETLTEVLNELDMAVEGYFNRPYKLQVRENVNSSCTRPTCGNPEINNGTCNLEQTRAFSRPGRQTVPKQNINDQMEILFWMCE